MTGGSEIRSASGIRVLTREELSLWRHATVDVKSNKKRDFALAIERPRKPTMSVLSTPFANKHPEPSGNEKRATALRPLAPLAPLEKNFKRRLASGKAQVDGMIDLHGLTQAKAHRALRNFLWRSAEGGAKLVLVITGKGLPAAGADNDEAARGVLRRNTPHWLQAPDLRSIVLGVEEAARTHGGSGALYVRLRRRLPS